MSVIVVIGELRQVVTLSNPGPPVPDGDGAYTQSSVPLDPPDWRCAIQKVTVRMAEQHFAATVIAHATHVVNGRYHAGITTQTRMVWTDRSGTVHTANVIDVDDTEGAGVETVAAITEIAQ